MNSSFKRTNPKTEDNSRDARSFHSGFSDALRGTTLDLTVDETMITSMCQLSPGAAILLVFQQVSKLKEVIRELCAQNEALKRSVTEIEGKSKSQIHTLKTGARKQRKAMHNAYQELNRRVLELTSSNSDSQESDFFRGFKELRNYAGAIKVDDAIDEEMYSEITNSDSRISGQTEEGKGIKRTMLQREEDESSDSSYVGKKIKETKPEEESKRVKVGYTTEKKKEYKRPLTAEPKKITKEAVKLDPATVKEIEGNSQAGQIALDTMIEVYGDALGRTNDPQFVEDMRVTTSEVKKIIDNRKLGGLNNFSPKNGRRSPVGGGIVFPDINRSPSHRGLRKLAQENSSKSMLDSPVETEIIMDKPNKERIEEDAEARAREIDTATKYYANKFLNEDMEQALKRREAALAKKMKLLEAKIKKPV